MSKELPPTGFPAVIEITAPRLRTQDTVTLRRYDTVGAAST
jgi:hypothetical protein